jgi:hypothetical protein
MQPEDMKPLFIPLKAIYFDAFASGEKSQEFRKYGARWNERTCPVGRRLVLSRGYGKQSRLYGTVGSAGKCIAGHVFKEIYGEHAECFAITPQGLSRELS